MCCRLWGDNDPCCIKLCPGWEFDRNAGIGQRNVVSRVHIAGIVGVILVYENVASDTDCRIFLLNSFSFSICGATNDEHRQARER